MPNLKPNSFTSYELSPEEELESTIFSDLQLSHLHNLLSSYAEEKIALDYDPEHSILFMQQEADLKAKIEVLGYIIDLSNTSRILMQERNNPAPAEI